LANCAAGTKNVQYKQMINIFYINLTE